MIVNAANLAGIYKSFSTIFNKAFTEAENQWSIVAMFSPSEGRSLDYKWLGNFPKLREWIGERVVKSLEGFHYELTNKPYEGTVAVDRDDIADDQIGVYSPMVSEMGRSAKVHPDEMIFSLLANGNSTTCFDGQKFFSTTHKVAGSNVSNWGAGSSNIWALLDCTRAIKPFIYQGRTGPQLIQMDDPRTSEHVFMKKEYLYGVDYRGSFGVGLWQLAYGSKQTLNATQYAAARKAMLSFKNDEGAPLGIKPSHLIVGPANEEAGREILLAERNDAGATNVWRNSAELIVVPWLD